MQDVKSKREEVERAIRSACPDLCASAPGYGFYRTARLSHVLRAMDIIFTGAVDWDEVLQLLDPSYATQWPLETDNLNDASDETINFLHDVLGL